MALKTLKPRLATLDTRTIKTVISADSWRTSTQTSAQRGYGYAWQKARAGHLANSPLCVMCERDGRVTLATVVDHSTPHRGDMKLFWDSSNWQALSKECHDKKTAREDGGFGNPTIATG